MEATFSNVKQIIIEDQKENNRRIFIKCGEDVHIIWLFSRHNNPITVLQTQGGYDELCERAFA